MKVSVSLPDADVQFLDNYATEQGFDSRSAVLHKAVRLLRAAELGGDYEEAWREWANVDEAKLWDVVCSDGLGS